MLLSRGKKDVGQPEVGPGFYPPMMHRLSLPEDQVQWTQHPFHSKAHSVEAMAKVTAKGGLKKYSLLGQVIPIYGFGIFLYIFYIIYKLTCKRKTNKAELHYSTIAKDMKSNIGPDHELAMLQERMLETERTMMRSLVSRKSHGSGSGRRKKSKHSTSKKEEKLLRELRQITQVMQEGRLEGASPEMEAEEVPYAADWEGYPEETYPEYDQWYYSKAYDTIVLEVPTSELPTAEALAERMEQDEEEEEVERKLEVVQEEEEEEEEEESEDEEEEEAERKQLLSPASPLLARDRREERMGLEVSKELQDSHGVKKQISFSDHEDVFHYLKEEAYEEEAWEMDEKEEGGGEVMMEEEEGEEEESEEESEEEEEEEDDQMCDAEKEVYEEDPVTEAESIVFSGEVCFSSEERAEEEGYEYLFRSAPGEGGSLTDDSFMVMDVGTSGLRMRNKRET